jgi:D-lactate dehydrogenase
VKVAVFSTKQYDRVSLDGVNAGRHEISYFEPHLELATAPLAHGHDAVCVFVNDRLDAAVIEALHREGIG